MFFLLRNICLLPIVFLTYIGVPFHYQAESSLRNKSEDKIREDYNQRKFEHYMPRFGALALMTFLIVMFGLLSWVSGGYLLLLIPFVFFIALCTDSAMAYSRYVYNNEHAKKVSSKNELVTKDHWRDTSLSSILDRRAKEIEKWKEDFKERTGKEPTDYDMRYN